MFAYQSDQVKFYEEEKDHKANTYENNIAEKLDYSLEECQEKMRRSMILGRVCGSLEKAKDRVTHLQRYSVVTEKECDKEIGE